MLQEKYLPQYHFRSFHKIQILATPEKIYPHTFNIDLSNLKIIYWLFKLRGLPTPVVLTTKALEKMCFVKLEEIKNKEIVFGLIGQFWKIQVSFKALAGRIYQFQ